MSTALQGAAAAPGGGGPLFAVEHLATHFPVRTGLFGRSSSRAVRAVDDVTFDIREGEVFGLVGESGSGKTTLGRSLLKLVQPTGGSIRYAGRDLVPLAEHQMRPLRRELALIFQDPNAALNPAMTIAQGVGHPLRIHGITATRAETRAAVAEMLERVGLSPPETFLDKYPEDVSGGQKQRLVIARALITRPRFVVADEPVAALDMSVRAKVLELLLDLRRDFGLTYLFITHDLATAKFLCDRIGILYLGNLVEWGAAGRLFADPAHPYTRALLAAIPEPDPRRRGRDKRLPTGEVPDALDPPAGCRFHPRCPDAFAPCGWEGRDVVEALEQRWGVVGVDVFEREVAATGPLDAVEVGPRDVRFPRADRARLLPLLAGLRDAGAARVFAAVTDVARDGDVVVVRLGDGVEPALQDVGDRGSGGPGAGGRQVACHLHGVVPRHRT